MQDLPPELDADARSLQEPEPIDVEDERALSRANLYLRDMRVLDHDYAEFQRQYDEERAELDARFEDRTAGLLRRRAELERILEGFGRAWKAQTGHAPKLLNGRLNVTAPKPSLSVIDTEAFVDWAEGTERLSLVRYKKEADKDAVKAATKAAADAEVPEPEPDRRYQHLVTDDDSGEVVPGVVLVTPTVDSVSVKVDEPKERA